MDILNRATNPEGRFLSFAFDARTVSRATIASTVDLFREKDYPAKSQEWLLKKEVFGFLFYILCSHIEV